ncbi:hypothetical protein F0562_015101 [Nyssa sinensis]|uniref:Uncharacterized protein n=1 Tax=Nyssa sinensis TaxID=561372 RepID=A0A5J4ZK27_9ASTE|nr:hypothetical protein F0562_015101 [Nyssa sinensis]
MEDEKKKRRNKKMKNKQAKITDDVAVGVGESASLVQNHIAGQNHQDQVSETSDFQSDGVQNADVDLDRHQANGTKNSILAEAEKQYWLDREASLEETIKHLEKENDLRIEKEAGLEMKILELQNEKDSWLQKEGGFEEKINQLIHETATLSLKGVSLEEKIKQLERERESWFQKENSIKETVASLNGANTRLQAQVMELEESRNNLFEENQRLIESISVLQSQKRDFERNTASAHLSSVSTMHVSEHEELNSQIEAAHALVGKLITENAELVEKVNELYVELNGQVVTTSLSSAVGSDLMVGAAAEAARVTDTMFESSEKTSVSGKRVESSQDIAVKDQRNSDDYVNAVASAHVADPMLESGEETSVSGKRMESLEDVAAEDERKSGDYVQSEEISVIPNPPETIDSEEIVQIPLDENEDGELELQAAHNNDEEAGVPLTDAPLIGAPFRLISFVARYVSGADLVNRSSVNSGQ